MAMMKNMKNRNSQVANYNYAFLFCMNTQQTFDGIFFERTMNAFSSQNTTRGMNRGWNGSKYFELER